MKKRLLELKIRKAYHQLLKQDHYLITNSLNERSITHRFAWHLQKLFRNYHVDCEYNGNVNSKNNRKSIYILKEELVKYLPKKISSEELLDNEIINKSVFPDIIVHKRGTDDNLLIIEVKKSISKYDKEFDLLKLRKYTSGELGNNLKYKHGIFIEIDTHIHNGEAYFEWIN